MKASVKAAKRLDRRIREFEAMPKTNPKMFYRKPGSLKK